MIVGFEPAPEFGGRETATLSISAAAAAGDGRIFGNAFAYCVGSMLSAALDDSGRTRTRRNE
jgi:hypothetical protein